MLFFGGKTVVYIYIWFIFLCSLFDSFLIWSSAKFQVNHMQPVWKWKIQLTEMELNWNRTNQRCVKKPVELQISFYMGTVDWCARLLTGVILWKWYLCFSADLVGMKNGISNWMHIFKWIDWSKICVGWWLNDECLLIYCRMTQMKVCTNLIFIIRCWFFVNNARNAKVIHAVNKQSNSANVDFFKSVFIVTRTHTIY